MNKSDLINRSDEDDEHIRSVPPRISAALEYCHHIADIEDVRNIMGASNLTDKENKCYAAALQALTLYFVGEIDCGDMPMHGGIDQNEAENEIKNG